MRDDLIYKAITVLDAMLTNNQLSHEELIKYVKTQLCFMPFFKDLSEEEIIIVVSRYETLYGIKTFIPGTTITNGQGNDSWFFLKKRKMGISEHQFQDRYEKYLQIEHFGYNAIQTITADTEKILSLCADPESSDKTRGLVMGDVQSGKTSNYLALANMACDYGYKIILILAGLTESLRIQTQDRVDEGLIGAESSTIGTNDNINYIGVGNFDYKYYCVPITTNKTDFKAFSATANDYNKPLVLVVKKNKSILEKLKKWLKPGQNDISSNNILIIDDECDNASVNTKTNENPSIINSLIRQIYNNFNCASYVGFTATPFANIFINPDNEDGNDDLFPKDFIHRLKAAPESYFGFDKVFSSESKHLQILDENEKNFLPVKHKRTDCYPGVCESLKDAICNFLICNCIRTIRKDIKKHRTMMINISRFNDLHEDIKLGVEEYVNKLTDIIFQYDNYPLDKFLKDPEMQRIYDLYTLNEFFEDINDEIDFEQIKNLLYSEVSQFKVAIVNNKYVKDNRFNYDDYKTTGARVIMIGGFVLSRGLTLSGLMTSYYSRASTAYDSLLQMCRWFGYRPNYEDLCSIYMSQISVDSFGAVIDAIRSLDEQFEMMKVEGKTPNDFGFMIKECPDSLETKILISARNKIKTGKDMQIALNYSGVDVDTSKLFKNIKYNSINNELVRKLYRDLIDNGYAMEHEPRHLFKDVDPKFIAKLVSKLNIPLENKKFDCESISKFISEKKYYDKWDIVFATGNEKDEYYELDELKIPPIERKFEVREDEDIIRISKNNNRLLEPGIFNAGLTEDEIKKVKEKVKDNALKNGTKQKNPIARDYLGVPNRNPLFIILPIKLTIDDKDTEKTIEIKQKIINSFNNEYLLGFGIGFAGKSDKKILQYKINVRKQQELLNKLYDDDEEEEEDND